MNAKRATEIERDYDVLGVELEKGFYGFYEPNSKTCAMSFDGLKHTHEMVRLDRYTVKLLRRSLDAMCELMGWEVS